MLIYFSFISCLVALCLSRELPKSKSRSNDLKVVESQEHNFLESPSYRRYQQSNGYNEEGGSAPEPYMFNYDIQDNDNNKQFRKEESNGNVVRGSYDRSTNISSQCTLGIVNLLVQKLFFTCLISELKSTGYVDTNGLYRTVEYIADSEHGFSAKIKTNEPGMDYYTDNAKSQGSTFPADVILEVGETPRNLQYSSSDQISNNHYGGENTNYRSYSRGKTNQQQYNEPDHYAASNNYDSQHFGRSLANDQPMNSNKEQVKTSSNSANYLNWNNVSPGKGFEYQSAFSDGHPVYVDSKSSKSIGPVSLTSNSLSKSLIGGELSKDQNADLSESNNKIAMIKNLKFNNKTISDKNDVMHTNAKKTITNLQLEKPFQQYKFVQQFRPFNEIREKFIREHPRRFTGFVNSYARV